MEEMQITSALSWIEVQFMRKAVDEVIRCRTTLMWTYGMAYYMDAGNQKELFEDNQRYALDPALSARRLPDADVVLQGSGTCSRGAFRVDRVSARTREHPLSAPEGY